jgi:hypothetical protein
MTLMDKGLKTPEAAIVAVAVPSGLANQFASLDAVARHKHYLTLNATIREKSESVVDGLATAKRALEELTPYLSEMQALLSQRGNERDRNADLPNWTEWFERFKEETKMEITLRAAQKRIAAFRDKKENREKPEPQLTLSQKEQRRLLQVQQCANEMVKALENGGDYMRPLEEYKRVAMPSEQLDTILRKSSLEPMTTSIDTEIADLALKAFEILNGNLGDRLIASEEGRKILDIAKKALAMKWNRKIGQRDSVAP